MRTLNYELVNALGTTVKTTTNYVGAKEWKAADKNHSVRISFTDKDPDRDAWVKFHNDRVKKTGKGKFVKM